MDPKNRLDPRLQELAEARHGTAWVLVEPDLPRPKIRLAPGGSARGARKAAGIEAPEDDAPARQVRDDLDALLTRLAGTPPRWLAAGQVFVIELDGAALATLATSPLVRRVTPNSRRQGP